MVGGRARVRSPRECTNDPEAWPDPPAEGAEEPGAEAVRRISTALAAALTERGWSLRRAAAASYPRVGGDDSPGPAPVPRGVELPPRGRGRRIARSPGGGQEGATPAWAGTTSTQTSCGRKPTSYPRVGGDDPSSRPSASRTSELPPRGRGRHSLTCAVVG